jgi:hypothetical protein
MVFDPYGYDLNHPAHQPVQPSDPLAAGALLDVPLEARDVLWRGLRDAAEGAQTLREQTPPGVAHEPPIFTVQHAGRPQFDDTMLRQQSLENWHRLMGIELRIGAQALEALILTDNIEKYGPMLAEQCARVGQLYREMQRRSWEWLAKALLTWELKLLRYRASPVVSPLVYD